ncbi:ester cyclase [Vibrio sp. SCSIO 43169]|uniref:nuclear transport factor 2 family protein n=1 Tax=Vibrio TaxID=662 RepID=UPI00204401A0|nr:ester cyclase [Vibrio sp. SCSIO 43169]MCM5506929.1 ester cyclase [Vibrio sp. SCSIO 43169]
MSLNIIEQFYQQYFNATLSEQASVAQQALNPDVKWSVAHPVNDLNGPEATHTSFLSPLVTAMPDVERRPIIVMNGEFEGRTWYNSTGYFVGTFEQPLFGIPATGKTLYLRYTEMVCVENNQITESYMIPDFIDAMNQSRVNPLRKSLGHDGLIPSPATADGIQNSDVCEEHSAKSGQLVHDMLACLGRFDGKDLYSMDLENYWHKDFMWYGPAGIGTTRGIKGFRNHHQAPFVFAFPDRSVDIELNFLAKNDYVSTGGWPHMHGTHTGHSGWLGLAPTGKNIELRVMDIWRREGDLLKENWVAIDIVHILLQLGYDVFGQMKEQLEGPNYA